MESQIDGLVRYYLGDGGNSGRERERTDANSCCNKTLCRGHQRLEGEWKNDQNPKKENGENKFQHYGPAS